MNRFILEDQNGFIALVSAVIFSAVLLALVSLSARGIFWERFSILYRENKEISVALAGSCVQAALLDLAEGKNMPAAGDEIIVDGPQKCDIGEINDIGSGFWEIIARANWENSSTNLKATAKLENGEIKIIDWREF
jgi:hypothetical protein